MYQTQHYSMAPVYEDDSCRCIGVLQQLQTLLSIDATLADVARMIRCFQQEFGVQEQLENVIQSLVSRVLKQQRQNRIRH